jgi:hypothetical protein
MNITINNLPQKFYPYLLGHESCPATFKHEIEKVFKRPLKNLKGNYIFDAGNWIIKKGRTDGLETTPDTHLYRIRKAVKIQKYIQSKGLEQHIMVPKKFLYWHEKESQFYVICEKVALSTEVPMPTSDYEKAIGSSMYLAGGQVAALAAGSPRRALTPIQAKAMAELSFLGYTDLTYNNQYFTLDGRVAIIDTEPHKRGLKKQFASSKIIFFLGDKSALLAQQSIAGIAKLKLYCSNPNALREVEKVEKKHVLWSIAKLIGKIAVGCLIMYFTPGVVALLPIGAVAIASLKITIMTILSIKMLFLSLNVLSVYYIWKKSHQGLEGASSIYEAELAGAF